jgi:hypothetical protein
MRKVLTEGKRYDTLMILGDVWWKQYGLTLA